MDSLSIELLRTIGDHLNVCDLTSLMRCCKGTYASIGGRYYFERQIQDELEFDDARIFLNDMDKLEPEDWLGLTLSDVKNWAEVREQKFSGKSEKAQKVFDRMDRCVDKWGAGVLYFTFSTTGFMWDWELCQQLPKSHRVGTLLNRVISSCSDTQILTEIIEAYWLIYPASLLGWRETPIRRRFGNAHAVNDLPPLFWACSENRVEALELFNRTNDESKMVKWEPIEFNMALYDDNRYYYVDGATTMWHKRPWMFIDPWECAFHPRNSNGQLKRGAISEEGCLWLLEHGVGFHSRPGGIPIQHLAEAAVLAKIHLVRALLDYFRQHRSTKKFQRAVTLALQAAAKARAARLQDYKEGKTLFYYDKHWDVIEELLHAVQGDGPHPLRPEYREAVQRLAYQG